MRKFQEKRSLENCAEREVELQAVVVIWAAGDGHTQVYAHGRTHQQDS